MRFSGRTGLIALGSAICMAGMALVANAQTTQLATWDTLTPPTAPFGSNRDFDPNFDNAPTCSGCWNTRNLAASGPTYSFGQTTNPSHVTQGTGAMRATFVGKGAGGPYSSNINGAPVEFDTHFDYPFVVTYSNNPAANGGVLDSRYTAINNAVNSENPGLYNFTFDIVYDIAAMRAIPWQAPEETVDPENNGQFPQRFFWVGMHGNSNIGPFTFTGFDQNSINPFDDQWDTNLFPVFNASFPLTNFNFAPNAAPGVDDHTFYQLGILYNSVFGTMPATANTAAMPVYFDNFRLVQTIPHEDIDYNNNGMADAGDWSLFMAQYLNTDPVAPPPNTVNPDISFDLIGAFGSRAENNPMGLNKFNNVVDFNDLQEFQRLYELATGAGGGALSLAVPEPSSLAMVLLSLVGLIGSRSRRLARPLAMLLAGLMAIVLLQQSAQAQIQLVEGFETPGRWQVWTGPDPNATPITVTYSPLHETQGANSLFVEQGSDTEGGFSWNAYANPNYTTGDTAWDVLSAAVRDGAEHYNFLADVTFDPVKLSDQGVATLAVTWGFNFVGQTIGTYAGETELFTTTTTVPLSAFDLGDVRDNGTTSYGAEIGFTGSNAFDLPYGVYIDNIRIEKISERDKLKLIVDATAGTATLQAPATNAAPVAWDYFNIRSTSGSLNPTGWTSLDDQNVGGANTWIEAGGGTAFEIAEASLLGNQSLNPGQSLPVTLGSLYNPSVNGLDLDFVIRPEGGAADRTFDQIVEYINVPINPIGDYNNNGVVDAADYTVWRNNLNTLFALPNRAPANTGPVSNADYATWKTNFGLSGSGAGGLTGVPVPEPSSLLLCFGAVGAFGAIRRRRVG